jgi:hypothetical protein
VTDPDDGTETNRWRESSEWVSKEIPELRIVRNQSWLVDDHPLGADWSNARMWS